MNNETEKKFIEELKSIRNFHHASPVWSSLLNKYPLPKSTVQAIKILKGK